MTLVLATLRAVPTPRTAAAGEVLRITGSRASRSFPLPGASFDLTWVHSVELTEWRETYTIAPGGAISLTAAEFSSFGAGLPDRLREGEEFHQGRGSMRIAGSHPPLEVLRIRLSGISHHVLHAGGRRIDLNELFGEDAISIRAVKILEKGKGGHR